MPCFVLRSRSLHVYMFRSSCLGLYTMFPLFCSSFCFVLMLGLCVHVLDTMSVVMLCSDLCAHMLFVMFYAQICIHTCLYAWIHVLPCLCVSFHIFTHALPCLCLDLHFYMLACSNLGFHMLICPDLCSYMLVCLDLCSTSICPDLYFHVFRSLLYFHAYMSKSMFLHSYMSRSLAFTSSMCSCAPCHVFVLIPRLCLSCYVLLQPFYRFTFLSCVLDMWLESDLYPMVFVIIHIPWPISEGLDHLFACLCLLASMLYLPCQPLQFLALLCLMPLAGYICVVTFDTHKALFGCNQLGGIFVMPIALCIPLPFLLRMMICLPCLFVPPVGCLHIFTRLLPCLCMSLVYQYVVHASTQ